MTHAIVSDLRERETVRLARWTILPAGLAVASITAALTDPLAPLSVLAAILLVVVAVQAVDVAARLERATHRIAVYERLAGFAADVHGTLDIDELARTAVRSARSVVAADAALLVDAGRGSGSPTLLAVDADRRPRVGVSALPDPRIAERAIHDRRIVVEPPIGATARALAAGGGRRASVRVAAPIVHDGTPVAALSLVRAPGSPSFDRFDVDALAMMAAHLGRAIGNVAAHAEVVEASIRDALTGLYNRRHLDTAIERMSSVRRRQPSSERNDLAAVLFDLDHFGAYNKVHGHRPGDDVLRTFGSVVRHHARPGDLVARYGGEEFLLLLEGADGEIAHQLADAVRAAFAAETAAAGTQVTVSAGCAVLQPRSWSVVEAVDAADAALGLAKSQGRNRVVSG